MVSSDCLDQSDLVSLVQTVQVNCDHGIQWPMLMRNNHVKFGGMLPKNSKSSAFWDMGVNSHLKWLLLFSPDEAGESGWHQSMVS